MKINPMLLTDFYKISHRIMSEEGTEKIYSTFTPRSSRIEGINDVVFFGLQGFIKDYLIDYFNDNFFNRAKATVVAEYKRVITYTLGANCANSTHIEELHDLGHLPIKIKAVKEGTIVPIRVPVFTIENTDKRFYWLTNFLETFVSACLWKVTTVATVVKKYRDICEEWADKTADSKEHIKWQCHNFSYRGMSGNEDAITAGAAHLLFFTGTDTIPSIQYVEDYYNSNIENELIGASVLATEHSIQCQYQDDLKYYTRMLTEVAPEGIISIVSDGYDYWNVIGNVIPKLKQTITSRNGKLVVRPDSGDPVKIICGSETIEDLTNNIYCQNLGDCKKWMLNGLVEEARSNTPHGECGDNYPEAIFKYQDKYYRIVADIFWNRYDKQFYYIDECAVESCKEIEITLEQKGSIEALWDIFGGTINSKGYKVLDPHIGLIYGDAITLERAEEIFRQLEAKGFSSENIVFGVGSYSLGYHTRDTFGFALKATYTEVNGVGRNIFKDPATDVDKIKKSQTGMLCVLKNKDGITLVDGMTSIQRDNCRADLLEDVFVDGVLVRDEKFSDIRNRVLNNL